MKIYLIAIGQRMPEWVSQAFDDYAKRLPSDYELILKALPSEKRSKTADTQRILKKESQTLLQACPKNTHPIALDRKGIPIDTQKIAISLNTWHDDAQDIALLIGGPEGITQSVLEQSHQTWSLSKLTLPHPLVRVLIAEQIYRAWSILSNHPYHR